MARYVTGSSAYAPKVLSVLRIVTALLFIEHGAQKLFGFPSLSPMGIVHPASFLGVAALLELIGGLLVAVGFLTRPVAFLLSGEMAIAYFLAHAPKSFYPVINGGEGAILFCFVFLYLAFAGGGAWSIDRAR